MRTRQPHNSPTRVAVMRRHGYPLVTSLVIAVATVVFFTAGCASGPVEYRDDSFTVDRAPRIIVDNVNGSIEVNATGSEGTVRVQATLNDVPRVKYQIDQEGDTITVKVETERTWALFRKSPGVDITVTAPSSIDVDLRANNGRIDLEGAQGTARLHTSNGALALKNVKGDIDGKTSNGKIELEAVEGTVFLETSNGSVNAEGVKGSFDIDTSNGSIALSGELVPGGNNRLETSNGSVSVKLQGTPSINLDASTSNGKVETALQVMTTSFDEEHVVGRIGDGAADLHIKTSNGNVSIE